MSGFRNPRRLHIEKHVSFADQQHPLSREDVETFDGTPIIPENLHEISLSQPSQGVMRALIRKAYQDNQLSPTFVDDVMTNLPNYGLPEDFQNSEEASMNDTYPTPPHSPAQETTSQSPINGEVTCVEYVPGENDIMSGALHMNDIASNEDFDDKTVCNENIWKQFKYMKWRMLTAQDLCEIDGLFNDRPWCFRLLKQFGDDFCITNEGLRRSLEDCYGTILEGWDRDKLVLGAISRRGGRLSRAAGPNDVLYPEDYVSVLDPGDDFLDIPYWKELYAQGNIWIESGFVYRRRYTE